jgi:hypothetical protein
VRTKGSLSATAAKLMVFKLVTAAAKTWRRLNDENQLPGDSILFERPQHWFALVEHQATNRKITLR